MLLGDISELPELDELGVIINCGTKEVATLALMSSLKYAGMPILLIDCESTDGSWEHFQKLLETHNFYLLSARRQGHGKTLDWLFRSVTVNKILLVDSDLEILDPAIIAFMKDYIEDERTYASGFTNGPGMCTVPFIFPDGMSVDNVYLEERPWIPLTLFKVSIVREALDHGLSFAGKFVANEFRFSEQLSMRLLRAKKRFPMLASLNLGNFFKESCHGHFPSGINYDTGSLIHLYLHYQKEYAFAGLPDRQLNRYTLHYGGITRFALDSKQSRKNAISNDATQRLAERYGYHFPA